MRKFAALLLLFALPVAGWQASWEQLRTLRPGEKIWIDYMKGDKLQSAKAEMGAWAEDSLSVRIGKSDAVLSRNDIRKVAVYAGKSRGDGAGLGVLVGAGVGAGLYGAIAAANQEDLEIHPAAVIAGGALLFAGVGAVIGLLVGRTKTKTIYQVAR